MQGRGGKLDWARGPWRLERVRLHWGSRQCSVVFVTRVGYEFRLWARPRGGGSAAIR